MPNNSKDRYRIVKVLALLLALLAASSQGLLAQSEGTYNSGLLFPKFTYNRVLSSGIALFNPSGSEASATFILLNPDGNILTNTTVKIPADGQVAKTSTDLFPSLTMWMGLF